MAPSVKYFNYKKVVASAGTRVNLAPATGSNLLAQAVTIQPLFTNGGNVYVGDAGVAASQGYILGSPISYGGSLPEVTFGAVPPVILSDIYIDVDTSGEGVRILGERYQF